MQKSIIYFFCRNFTRDSLIKMQTKNATTETLLHKLKKKEIQFERDFANNTCNDPKRDKELVGRVSTYLENNLSERAWALIPGEAEGRSIGRRVQSTHSYGRTEIEGVNYDGYILG